MPELPEVETIRVAMVPLLTGAVVHTAESDGNRRYTSVVGAEGEILGTPTRRGKFLLLPFEGNDQRLVVHLGMSGQLHLRRPDDAPTRHWRARLTLLLPDGQAGVLELVDPRGFGRACLDGGPHRDSLAHLGTEPFDHDFPAQLQAGLRGRKAPVKALLLDQRVVAGVGNIYADESLWAARVHPMAPGGTVDATVLAGAVVDALHQGLRNGGTTLRDYRQLDGSTGSNQNQLSVYGRSGQPCPRCTVLLERTRVAGRGTTFCPRCQRSA